MRNLNKLKQAVAWTNLDELLMFILNHYGSDGIDTSDMYEVVGFDTYREPVKFRARPTIPQLLRVFKIAPDVYHSMRSNPDRYRKLEIRNYDALKYINVPELVKEIENYRHNRIIAKFKGRDGSLGYKTGNVYKLAIQRNTIIRLDGSGYCAYGSIESFLNNWETSNS